MTREPRSMHIGELAERTGLSLRTLRHYDEVGLVKASGRTDGGFRVYTETDYERLMLIRRMKPLGFSLEEMADLLSVVDDGESATDASQALDQFVAQAIERREKLREQIAMADEFIDLLESRRSVFSKQAEDVQSTPRLS
ncbi:MerR family transcriptional regulator [Leifsonia sp. PS1209]|uniref:MerR family transcriptional regulator n=1 Tax=Leifsonia sp. PS1209 TaxID=2724914 RepID=UPI001442E5FF|nr:MerR family transcriptional regulator [Leifsonia sp. PS1209]QIZ99828.1 MerR family transcriptional regulator [Leifsonia sp. PS1209]